MSTGNTEAGGAVERDDRADLERVRQAIAAAKAEVDRLVEVAEAGV